MDVFGYGDSYGRLMPSCSSLSMGSRHNLLNYCREVGHGLGGFRLTQKVFGSHLGHNKNLTFEDLIFVDANPHVAIYMLTQII